MNNVCLIGRLTADPEWTETSNGAGKCAFRLAVDREFKNQNGERDADFIAIVAWRKLGELCQKYLQKGKQCAIRGSLRTRNYQAQDGTKRYVTEVEAQEVKFLSNKTNDGQAISASETATNGFTEVDDDQLPF